MELSFRWAQAAVVAEGVARQVIHQYKYHRALWLEPLFADLLRRTAPLVLQQEHWDMIVPVPLHPLKEREREFNQAQRLARLLSKQTQIPVNSKVLRRVEYTRTQTALNRTERVANVRHAFAVMNGLELTGRRVVLFDDVLTTGSTASACAKALKTAGVSDVCVWTLARACGPSQN
jgi:ComF family protein